MGKPAAKYVHGRSGHQDSVRMASRGKSRITKCGDGSLEASSSPTDRWTRTKTSTCKSTGAMRCGWTDSRRGILVGTNGRRNGDRRTLKDGVYRLTATTTSTGTVTTMRNMSQISNVSKNSMHRY